MYAQYYGMLTSIAAEHGYAIALHGSFTRDLDLVAVPWTQAASLPAVLLKAVFECIGWTHDEDTAERVYQDRTEQPHGRTSYAIPTGAGGYIDLSIMQLTNQPTT